jgi:hypothetical protein
MTEETTHVVLARNLTPGTLIIRDGEIFPYYLYRGTVDRTEETDKGIRIVLRDGEFTRDPDHPLVCRKET